MAGKTHRNRFPIYWNRKRGEIVTVPPCQQLQCAIIRFTIQVYMERICITRARQVIQLGSNWIRNFKRCQQLTSALPSASAIWL